MEGDVHAALAALADLDRQYRQALAAADRESVLRQSVARLIADGAVDVAWVGQQGPGDDLTIGITAGARTGVLTDLAVPSGSGLTGKVFRHAAPEWVDDYFGSASITHDFDRQIAAERIHRLIAVPIVVGGQPSGVLAAGMRTAGAFGGRAIEQLVGTANSAALAVTAAERARHAAELAVHEERRRVAVQLHDTVGALLYAIGAGLRELPDTDERVAALTDQAGEASRLLREALRALHASPADIALSAAVTAECDALTERSGVRAHVITIGELPPLDHTRLRTLARAVREALRNVERHAHAQSVAVTVSTTDTELTIAVTDDGTGFDPDPAPHGIGLASTATELAAIGGTLDVQANPDGGTLWRARLLTQPLQHPSRPSIPAAPASQPPQQPSRPSNPAAPATQPPHRPGWHTLTRPVGGAATAPAGRGSPGCRPRSTAPAKSCPTPPPPTRTRPRWSPLPPS